MSDATGGDKRVINSSGDTFIPATQRPDGTWRKPLKVRAGYIPADEKPRFQCKAQREANNKAQGTKFPIGWSPRELQKEALKVIEAKTQKTKARSMPVAAVECKNTPITPEDHIQKKINGLRKKLDDIEKLQKRITCGELKDPEKTQLQKIERKPQLIQEMDKLSEELARLNAV